MSHDIDIIGERIRAELNALGPFVVGQVVRIKTEATNSSGSVNSAVRTITIEEPIG